jgi:hypothetical protein
MNAEPRLGGDTRGGGLPVVVGCGRVRGCAVRSERAGERKDDGPGLAVLARGVFRGDCGSVD